MVSFLIWAKRKTFKISRISEIIFPLSPVTLYGSVQSHQCLSPPTHNATEECLFIQHPASDPDILYTPAHELYIGINLHC